MKKRNKWGMNLIYRLTQILFGILVLAIVLDVGLMVYLGTSSDGDTAPHQVRISVPAKLQLEESGTYMVDGFLQNILVESVNGSMLVSNVPHGMVYLMGVFLLVVLVVIGFPIWEFLKMLGRLRNEEYFEDTNVRALRNIALWMAGIWFAVEIGQMLVFSTITSRIEIQNMEVQSNYELSFQLLFAALFVWVLGYIFEEGLRIKREQELTI